MESYSQFINRIDSFEKPKINFGEGDFIANEALKHKVDEHNKFKPFYGDTTVFDLTPITKMNIASIVNTLYSEAGECFSERLKDSTYHITLHDLSNSNNISEIGEEMFRNEIKLLKYVHSKKIQKSKIQFKTNNIINMVGVTLVLALKPKTEEDYNSLMTLYSIVDCVKTLPYLLTPHITLAYFNPDGFSKESADNLSRVVEKLNQKQFEISAFTDTLYYEKFTDMNSYHRVFSFNK